MKKNRKAFSNSILAVLFIMATLTVSSCEEPDANPMIIHNATSETIGFLQYSGSYDKVNGAPVKNIPQGESYTIRTSSTCSLHVLFDGYPSSTEIQKNGICVKKWNYPVISRSDSDCHSFYNLQSWEQRSGEKKHECARFIFTVREEDLKE